MNDENNNVHFHINLKQVLMTIRTAINEAGIYAGFTYNLKKDDSFIKFDLVEDSSIQFVPITTNSNTISEYKEFFYKWVINNTFKYVVDRFSIFLDQLYEICKFYTFHKVKYSNGIINEIHEEKKRFHKKQFSDKLAKLKSDFDIAPSIYDDLMSMQQVRNCLTHRSGFVGQADTKNTSQFIVKWSGFNVYAKESSGTEHDLSFIPPEGLHLPEGADIIFRKNIDKQKSFHLNEKINFTAREFAEILMYLQAEATHLIKGVEKFAISKGVPVTNE